MSVWAWLSLIVVESMEQESGLVVMAGKMGIPWFDEVLGIDFVGVSKVGLGTIVGLVWCGGSWLGMMVDALPTSISCRGRLPSPSPA